MQTFEKTLRELRSGQCLTDLNLAIQEITKNVRATGRKGVVTLKLTLAPMSKGDADVILLEDEVKTAPPKIEKAKTVFYSTEDGGLQREDPKQAELPLRVVERPAAELKTMTAS